jgi:hypothetical protein
VCHHIQKDVLLLNLYKLWVMTYSGLSLGDCIKILLYTSTGCLIPLLGETEQSCAIVTLLNFVSFSNCIFIDAYILQKESK